MFVGENLPGDEPWASHLRGRIVRHEGNPVVRLTGGFDDYLRGRSANFRQQVRARDRRLSDRYAVRFRLCTDPDRLDPDLDTLFLLHRRRFGKHSAFTGARTGFHREFAHVALEQGWLRLWMLELDGRLRSELLRLPLRRSRELLPVRARAGAPSASRWAR